MKQKVKMTVAQFWEEYGDKFEEIAYEIIMSNTEEYFDGYTGWTDADYPEVYEEHKDEILSAFLDEYEIELI